MTYQQILNDLKNKKYSPIYFLYGEEPYFIDVISDYIMKNVLSEQEKAFNQTILYGKDTEAATVINAAKRFPMGAQRQVIIVKEAQNLKNIDDLQYYLENPLSSTLLVINFKYKKLDKRKKIYKLLSKHAVMFESKKLYDNQVPEWISKYLQPRAYSIQPPAALLLTEFLGGDLSKVSNELEKLIIVLAENEKQITINHIEENIGISKDFNNIELQKALTKKDALKAYRIVEYFGQNQKNHPIVLTINSLYTFFSRIILLYFLKDKSKQSVATNLGIHPFFVSDYTSAARTFPTKKSAEVISLLREYDRKSKGVENISANPGELLKELVYKILN